MYLARLFYLVGILAFSGRAALAQQPGPAPGATPNRAKYAQPYRILGTDSVALFYTANYELCPPGCAAIRRHARLDSTGNFFGYVRDFWMHNAQLALTGTYRSGRKDGAFEVFHPNGELAARGYYRGGQQVGSWAYWYPSGQKRQVLSFGNGSTLGIEQFWTEDGQQLVQNGQGTWYRTDAGLRVSGSVATGRPEGRWRVQEITGGQKVLAEETFKKGVFRMGSTRAVPGYYYDQSRIYITDLDSYSETERFVQRPSCPPDPPETAQ
ncbi:hypothetical protein K3G63_15050 [Hymenobacter sp. HSC-4F20]|uniref:toxin-antitoxin system YwqK family antitoxin n=1 Tax=Hymenobacter sp. HSC-4F20 TaxID=2864135 RepID=UPI001C73D133|nr:hypothetical protein [Hymenobacter sp. HSC-4F20]MBX0291767.1 hypothetical protein [Hymenobacter sp. HSC-4F20]